MKKQIKRSHVSSMLNRTRLYGFELFMALFSLTMTAFVADYAVFVLFRYLTRNNDFIVSSIGDGQLVLLIAAASLVWLPVAMIFYLRSRGTVDRHAMRGQSMLHKILVSIYFFVHILVAVGMMLFSLYILLQLIAGTIDSENSPLVRYVAPGMLATAWHSWCIFAFSSRGFVSRKLFANITSAIVVVLLATLLTMTIGDIRNRAMDDKTEDDLTRIQSAVDDYFVKKDRLPSSLADVSRSKLNNSVDSYTYNVKSDKKYELCANFVVNTIDGRSDQIPFDYTPETADEYTAYAMWHHHESGKYCYKLRAYSHKTPTDNGRSIVE